MVFWESRPFTTPTFVTFGSWAENPQFDHPRRKISWGALCAPGKASEGRRQRAGKAGGCRVSSGPMITHIQTSLSIHLRLPDSCRYCHERSGLSNGGAACGGVLRVLCILEFDGLCSLKYGTCHILALLGICAVSPPILDLGVPYGRKSKSVHVAS